jgi:hypothetical protein
MIDRFEVGAIYHHPTWGVLKCINIFNPLSGFTTDQTGDFEFIFNPGVKGQNVRLYLYDNIDSDLDIICKRKDFNKIE